MSASAISLPRSAPLFEPYRRCGSAERDRLVQALKATQWNKTQAARALNWSRMTLYRKLAHYHIGDDDG
ncbi:MAG: helix-turn-helix domain-containing protein [Rhodospirillales bacterium]